MPSNSGRRAVSRHTARRARSWLTAQAHHRTQNTDHDSGTTRRRASGSATRAMRRRPGFGSPYGQVASPPTRASTCSARWRARYDSRRKRQPHSGHGRRVRRQASFRRLRALPRAQVHRRAERSSGSSTPRWCGKTPPSNGNGRNRNISPCSSKERRMPARRWRKDDARTERRGAPRSATAVRETAESR